MAEAGLGEQRGIVAPRQRDLAGLEDRLRHWLATRLDGAGDIRLDDLRYPRGAGLSHETILFDAAWTERGTPRRRGMVIRIKPTGHAVYQIDQFDQQYAIMAALHRSGVGPVAEPLWLEHDPAIVGAPFFVMEQRHGRVPVSFPPYAREGWMMELAAAARRTLWENAVRALAGIQSLPLGDVRFLDPQGRFSDGFDQEWQRWQAYFAWATAGGDHRFLDGICARLERTRPADRQPGIVWGDARIGNMMFADDLSVAAVMDWESPGIGGALHDLGYWLVMSEIETTDKGVKRLDGMGSRGETIALWRETTGIAGGDIEWHERFAAFKLACLAIRTLALRGQEQPRMNRFDNPATRALAALYGLPESSLTPA